MAPFYVLEVRGRRSGRTITLPVDPIEFEGHRYLVCARAFELIGRLLESGRHPIAIVCSR